MWPWPSEPQDKHERQVSRQAEQGPWSSESQQFCSLHYYGHDHGQSRRAMLSLSHRLYENVKKRTLSPSETRKRGRARCNFLLCIFLCAQISSGGYFESTNLHPGPAQYSIFVYRVCISSGTGNRMRKAMHDILDSGL